MSVTFDYILFTLNFVITVWMYAYRTLCCISKLNVEKFKREREREKGRERGGDMDYIKIYKKLI